MATMTSVLAVHEPLEDALAYLPCSTIASYRKGTVIYTQDEPADRLYLVISGKVKISRMSDDGQTTLADIYQRDEFFGESVFLNVAHRAEEASATEETKVMAWGGAQLEDLMEKRPRLAMAMVKMLGDRSMNLMRRVESFATDDVGLRLSKSLIRFAERMGERREDGGVEMPPLTHETLAQYVGTSREIVTHYMNRLRSEGFVQYSRKSIVLYRDALRESTRHAA